MTPTQLRRIRTRLVGFAEDLFASILRKDQRRWGQSCLRGLLLDGKRKSIQPMATRLARGDPQPDFAGVDDGKRRVYPLRVAALAAIALAAGFGAGDQYLGSLSAHPWAVNVSLLSAPWLVLAFLAGWTQRQPRRAAVLGFACTVTALLAYGVMTLSPVENAHLTAHTMAGFLVSESRVIVGALFTGPLFGWFGNRWRARRTWAGALAVAGAVSLEPLAHAIAGNTITIAAVSITEVAVGITMLAYVSVVAALTHTRARQS